MKLRNAEDLKVVLEGGHYFMHRRIMLVKKWKINFDFKQEILAKLLFTCWGRDPLTSIGSLLGVPLCVDECTSKQNRLPFLSLLIELDVTKVIPHTLYVMDADGQLFLQRVIVELITLYSRKNEKDQPRFIQKWVVVDFSTPK